jgi:hypothetical protein
MVSAILAWVAVLGPISRAASSSTARSILILSFMPHIYRLDVTTLSQNRVPRLTLVNARTGVDRAQPSLYPASEEVVVALMLN